MHPAGSIISTTIAFAYRPDSHRLVSEFGEHQQRWHTGLRGKFEVAYWRESQLVLFLRAAGILHLRSPNEYNPQMTKAGLQSFPIPSSPAQLNTLTSQVLANNHFAMPMLPDPIMQAVHAGVQHVIYILKENQTYDQMLGDLTNQSNSDPALTYLHRRSRPISTPWH